MCNNGNNNKKNKRTNEASHQCMRPCMPTRRQPLVVRTAHNKKKQIDVVTGRPSLRITTPRLSHVGLSCLSYSQFIAWAQNVWVDGTIHTRSNSWVPSHPDCTPPRRRDEVLSRLNSMQSRCTKHRLHPFELFGCGSAAET